MVEVLLSLALVSVLLVAMNQFLLSMTELWGANRQQRLFDQHVRAVARHVEDLLQRGTLVADADRRLRVETSVVPGVGRGPLLTFELPAGDRLFPWPERPLPDVQCAVDFVPEQGLVLYWQSRWEIGYEKTTPRSLVISPLVRGIEYEYYRRDTRSWTARSSPIAGNGEDAPLPVRCRLHFQYDRFSADRVVRIPPAVQALPAF